MKNIKKPLIFVVAIGLIYYAFSTLYLAIATFFVTMSILKTYGTIHPEILTQAIVDQVFISTLFAQISTLLLCLVLLYKERLKSFLNFKKLSGPLMIFSLIAGLSMVFLSQIIIDLIAKVFPRLVEDSLGELTDLLKINSWLLFVPVVIMAPIVEEILYRGILFRVFKKEMIKPVWIILMSGLIFGVIHLNFVQSTYATILGILMALAYYWTKNILVPILMHFGNNLLAVIITFESIDQQIVLNQAIYDRVGLWMAAFMLPLMMIFLFIFRDKNDDLVETEEFKLTDQFIYAKDISKLRLNIMFSVMIIFTSISISFIEGFLFMSIFAVPAILWMIFKWYKFRAKNRFKDMYKKYLIANRLSQFVIAYEKLEQEPLSEKNLALSQMINSKVWAFYQIERAKKLLNAVDSKYHSTLYDLSLALLQLVEKDVSGFESTFAKIKESNPIDKQLQSYISLLESAYKIHVLDQPDQRILKYLAQNDLPKAFLYYLISKHYHLNNQPTEQKTYIYYAKMHDRDMEQIKPYLNALI
jgi:uncharacterized protein